MVNAKKWKALKAKLKYLTKKTIPLTFDERIKRLNYFKQANIQGKLKKLDEWLRNRLRYCIWHDWKIGAERKS